MASKTAIAEQLPGREPPPGERPLLVLGMAGLSASAGLVHASVAAEHFRVSTSFGLFFVALSAFQVGWAVLTLLRPSRHLYWVAAGVNAAVVFIWVVSRTTGIPMGPGAGVPEPVGRPDVFTTAAEVIIVASSLALLRPLAEAVVRPLGRAVLMVALVAAPVTGLVSIVASPQRGHHQTNGVSNAAHAHEHDHGHGRSHAVGPDSRERSTHAGHAAEHVVLGGASGVFGAYLVARRLRRRRPGTLRTSTT